LAGAKNKSVKTREIMKDKFNEFQLELLKIQQQFSVKGMTFNGVV